MENRAIPWSKLGLVQVSVGSKYNFTFYCTGASLMTLDVDASRMTALFAGLISRLFALLALCHAGHRHLI